MKDILWIISPVVALFAILAIGRIEFDLEKNIIAPLGAWVFGVIIPIVWCVLMHFSKHQKHGKIFDFMVNDNY